MIENSVFLESKKTSVAFLCHLGYNMWAEPIRDTSGTPCVRHTHTGGNAEAHLRFDLDLWHDMTRALAAAGCNTVVIHIGEGFQYESHPHLACRGAWTKDVLCEEIFNLKMLGMEAIPMLNFSCAHSVWMGEMRERVSTEAYHSFCAELISEISEVFGRPRLFHIGMDDESPRAQAGYNTCVTRTQETWWQDLVRLASAVMRAGARPWIWSDGILHKKEEFLKRMPRDILQSYRYDMTDKEKSLSAYGMLERHGYDQLIAAEGEALSVALENAKGMIDGERMYGCLQCAPLPMMKLHRARQRGFIDALASAKRLL